MFLRDALDDQDLTTASLAAIAPGKRSLTASLQRRAVSRKAVATAGGGPTASAAPRVSDDPFAVHLGGAAVQRAGATEGADAPDAVHAAAARGTAGPGQALPFLDAIQASFGRHDVGGVRAHLGAEATAAAHAMGASAFATDGQVAFAGAPDLHTAAHEAAHVVQQRAGVQLKGGVGEDGDPYERHADEVADRVVAGRSAEDLLDRHAGGGGGAAVQRARVGPKTVATNVTAYPTKEGAQPGEDDLPLDEACLALIQKAIFPALEELGERALKTNRKTEGLTGYMIGVARTRDGRFIGATSGAAPEEAAATIRAHVDRFVRANVPEDAANRFVAHAHGAEASDGEIHRLQVVHGKERGGLAGFCAAFKMLYAHPELELVGMAEVVYSPKGSPAPTIASADDTHVTYEHGDTVPSCLTCQAALHALQARGRELRAIPKHAPVSSSSAKPLRSRADELAARREELARFADRMGGIPDELLGIKLSNQQHKAAGDLLATAAEALTRPLTIAARLIGDDVAVMAEDDRLVALLRGVSLDCDAVKDALSMSLNEASKGTGVEAVKRNYASLLQSLSRSAEALASYLDELVETDQPAHGGPGSKAEVEHSGAASSSQGGKAQRGKALLELVDDDTWGDELIKLGIAGARAPEGLTVIDGVAPADGLVYLNSGDDVWVFDRKTGAITKEED
ncbi:MAG: DUF4157 domain-containing protein [Myxococcales bacterium]|nr:DUF4157 domain-containing protein [Myxococcales bacterium]